MDGLTPPNSPKYCKSCMLFAGLKAMVSIVFMLFKIRDKLNINQYKSYIVENKTEFIIKFRFNI
ncbi:hypothetical protein GCM10007028_05830 [Algibacter mikhailovii]|uniref:Uncharacterized protein n=1 Tax=Algibacter mikhailovii TaxID=425498 RepID=A0A918QXE8_9FLAO|nr:hypothetical protein GCM10007028_05830 [Algibacter mikhailovii]